MAYWRFAKGWQWDGKVIAATVETTAQDGVGMVGVVQMCHKPPPEKKNSAILVNHP